MMLEIPMLALKSGWLGGQSRQIGSSCSMNLKNTLTKIELVCIFLRSGLFLILD